jgi:secondary thiamine-phosphate synthase enzyme
MVVISSIEIMSNKEFEMVRITDDVRKAVDNSSINDGIVFVITAHTTTGIMVNESLECLEIDIEETLERLIPTRVSYAHSHFLPTYGATGGNAPGHLKSMLCGNHCVLPVKAGQLVVGKAQEIYFVEFDGVQLRTVHIVVMGE